MKSKKTKIKEVSLLAVVLLILSVSSFSVFSEDIEWYEWLWGSEISGSHGNPVTNWYEISQWEVDVCFGWGGTDDPNSFSQNNIMGDYYHNLMISLQAESSEPLEGETVSTGTKIYEIAWFIQPTDLEESINFEVYITDNHGERELIESGTSNYVNGVKGYNVRESPKNFTEARIYYWNDEREKEYLKVPFVE